MFETDINCLLTGEFHLSRAQVDNVVSLIDAGNTIPFIARYRKEMTDSLDDQVLRELSERLTALRSLNKRREEVAESIAAQEKLTDEIKATLAAALTLTEIEDIYRPFRPKRRTRATVARERGLEPLAELLKAQGLTEEELLKKAEAFIAPEKELPTPRDALNGALDILAEEISDDAALRKQLRERAMREGVVASKAAKKEDSVYAMYYDYAEPALKIPGHRILAIDRGEREEFLKVSLQLEEENFLPMIERGYIGGRGDGSPKSRCESLIAAAAQDAWRRLIFPSIEREVRSELTDRAQEQAIHVFSLNLRQLLLQPPVRGHVALGLDPAYRTGCKVAVVDKTGRVLDTTVIYPTPPQKRTEEAEKILTGLIEKHEVDVIAIGNGTASKETEIFAANLLKKLPRRVSYMVVSEAGASVYSASKLAAQEFPEYDVSLRSAVSIARRLQDPLAELVKIDPKAIGVGQYQHDLKPARLDEALGGVVESCVNSVGVDLNTASFSLLSHIAGLSQSTAKNVVAYREGHGQFKRRSELLKVPKLGPRAYEQCAGFLRIPDGELLLDSTAVHPESYGAAQKLLGLLGFTIGQVACGGVRIADALRTYGENRAAEELGVGLPTLHDIVSELEKPGRDPRDELPAPLLRTDILDLKDLKPGMELKGTVRNVIDFGAFVDIGVHQDGLVHISQMSSRFIRHPSEIVKVGDIVTVWVLGVEPAKKRISLTMKEPPKA